MVLGWELFIGDHLGQVLAAASMLVPSVYQPHIGEAVAFRWALETARHLSFSRILFETDCASMEKQAYSKQYLFCWFYTGLCYSGRSKFERVESVRDTIGVTNRIYIQKLKVTNPSG